MDLVDVLLYLLAMISFIIEAFQQLLWSLFLAVMATTLILTGIFVRKELSNRKHKGGEQ